MPTNEYMTPEIGKVIPMLSQTCDELTRQALIRGLTEKTQEWVEGDPELADILFEGKKTLEECVRYVTEKAACVVAKNINSMLNAEMEQLPRMNIQGKEATMAGGAIDAEQVFKWAQEYYYTPGAKATDFKKEAENKATEAKRKAEAKKAADAKKAAADKKKGKSGAAKGASAPAKAPATADSKQTDAPKEAAMDLGEVDCGEQISMFGDQPDADAA